MSHWAEVGTDGVVTRVIVGPNDDDDGEAWVRATYPGIWLKTSYNTHAGVHHDNDGNPDGKPGLRMNYAGPGYRYDPTLDAFIPPQPFASWTLDPTTCEWQPPTPRPDDGPLYRWDESTQSWVPLA